MDYIYYNYACLLPKTKDEFYHILYMYSINGLIKSAMNNHISNNGKNAIKYTPIITSIKKNEFEKKTFKQKHVILGINGLIS